MNQRVKNILIIRFSSFGDIIQSLNAVIALKKAEPNCRITFLTKSEFITLIESCVFVDKTILFNKQAGFLGLIGLAFKIRKLNFNFIYDAHSNLRTRIIKLINFDVKTSTRSKNRIKRFLLFRLRKNLFQWPFRGAESFIAPIKKITKSLKVKRSLNNFDFKINLDNQYINKIVFCPSAAWDTKRWPVEHWKKLIHLVTTKLNLEVLILGGPQDHFCKKFESISDKVTNLAGKMSLIESCAIIKASKLVVSGDTGLIHMADILGVAGIELVGPSAFGYVSGPSIKVLEKNLACKPCSKDGSDGCSQRDYKHCLTKISVDEVYQEVKRMV